MVAKANPYVHRLYCGPCVITRLGAKTFWFSDGTCLVHRRDDENTRRAISALSPQNVREYETMLSEIIREHQTREIGSSVCNSKPLASSDVEEGEEGAA